ncbi:hypothetical protein SAMN03159371_04367 [Variovorax sp. NFACC28]|nr:hypothetical protein SAMN03159371_04367 [Variovorax sp. NFACC28]SEG86056.1 hypothetical protein SAMN03159365_04725 [Variovorax sp. NFACC29]SFD22849.1 hypothetical protein SAMN03159379_04614 [Variovorax sp. NFACC26]SFG29665.1 hypothetical protein SAMN03159447_02724 [Variovorax sp. NFACC27]
MELEPVAPNVYSGDAVLDTAALLMRAAVRMVDSLSAAQLGRLSQGPALRHIEQLLEGRRIVAINSLHVEDRRGVLAAHEAVALAAEVASVCGVGVCVHPLGEWGATASSRLTQHRSNYAAPRSSVNESWRRQRYASVACQSHRLRQRLVPPPMASVRERIFRGRAVPCTRRMRSSAISLFVRAGASLSEACMAGCSGLMRPAVIASRTTAPNVAPRVTKVAWGVKPMTYRDARGGGGVTQAFGRRVVGCSRERGRLVGLAPHLDTKHGVRVRSHGVISIGSRSIPHLASCIRPWLVHWSHGIGRPASVQLNVPSIFTAHTTTNAAGRTCCESVLMLDLRF